MGKDDKKTTAHKGVKTDTKADGSASSSGRSAAAAATLGILEQRHTISPGGAVSHMADRAADGTAVGMGPATSHSASQSSGRLSKSAHHKAPPPMAPPGSLAAQPTTRNQQRSASPSFSMSDEVPGSGSVHSRGGKAQKTKQQAHASRKDQPGAISQ